jgi:hypothetical protein
MQSGRIVDGVLNKLIIDVRILSAEVIISFVEGRMLYSPLRVLLRSIRVLTYSVRPLKPLL